jgi:phenylpropionate dioxygenase-like ring-hydroxylating dioxygenase large terminal subunit
MEMASHADKRIPGNRHPAETYDQILDRDSRKAPDHFRQQPGWDAGTEPVPVEHYYTQDYFDLEVEHMWSRVWQLACREEHIPNHGDIFRYENVGKSVIVVRTKTGEIKAFYNSCPHRGRQLIDSHCNRPELWCPFHGMSWNLDGSQKANPIPWDFPQWEDGKIPLPEVRVDRWAGYIFVNFDEAAGKALCRSAFAEDRCSKLEGHC